MLTILPRNNENAKVKQANKKIRDTRKPRTTKQEQQPRSQSQQVKKKAWEQQEL